MRAQNIFFPLTQSVRVLALAICVLANCRAIVWSAESLRFGFSGATATQLAGALAVEQKLFERYGIMSNLRNPRDDHDPGSRFR
jgi:hypothetical protein